MSLYLTSMIVTPTPGPASVAYKMWSQSGGNLRLLIRNRSITKVKVKGYQMKNFFFLLWVNLYMITGIYLHDPPPFNGPFFMTPPFSESQKVVTLPQFPPSLPPPPC